MDNNSPYWKDLVSMALRLLLEKDNQQATFVIRKGILAVDFYTHDNWDGGIDYWNIVFQLKYRDFAVIAEQKERIEKTIEEALTSFHTDGCDLINSVIIRPVVERIVDWGAIVPLTKEKTIQLIEEEKNLLSKIAISEIMFTQKGVEEEFQSRHQQICLLAEKAGFDYPVQYNTLAEWWNKVKTLTSYNERRVYVSQLFEPLLQQLYESEEFDVVNFNRIASQSGSIHKAIEDAHMFISEEKYESAVDRVHTALHGYLRLLLCQHGISYNEDDSLPALYSKLHGCYVCNIQPSEVGERIKNILRSGSGMINTVNELRNNNTLAHPNNQLIQKREALLVIRLVNAIINYIEDVEMSLK